MKVWLDDCVGDKCFYYAVAKSGAAALRQGPLSKLDSGTFFQTVCVRGKKNCTCLMWSPQKKRLGHTPDWTPHHQQSRWVWCAALTILYLQVKYLKNILLQWYCYLMIAVCMKLMKSFWTNPFSCMIFFIIMKNSAWEPSYIHLRIALLVLPLYRPMFSRIQYRDTWATNRRSLKSPLNLFMPVVYCPGCGRFSHFHFRWFTIRNTHQKVNSYQSLCS